MLLNELKTTGKKRMIPIVFNGSGTGISDLLKSNRLKTMAFFWIESFFKQMRKKSSQPGDEKSQ